MKDNGLNSEAISKSPCIDNCCLDEDDVCMGCYRTISEITAWHESNAKQRLVILNNCESRKKQFKKYGL